MNYFKLFDLKKQFYIDKKVLTKNFYKLQLKFHPDLFINSSNIEKKNALEKSIKINKGYKILKNSLRRAIYLLSLYDIKIDTEKILIHDNILLKKYFSLYEELDNLKKNNFDQKKYEIFLNKIEKKIKKFQQDINIEFNHKNFKQIIIIIKKLFFLEKIKTTLKIEKNMYCSKKN